MVFTVVFKTPDVVNDALSDLNLDPENEGEEHYNVEQVLKKFIKYSELIYVEFDSDKMTATVKPI